MWKLNHFYFDLKGKVEFEGVFMHPWSCRKEYLVTEGTSAFVSVADGLVCTTGPEISKPVAGFSTLNLI